jgi:hypothetical protein
VKNTATVLITIHFLIKKYVVVKKNPFPAAPFLDHLLLLLLLLLPLAAMVNEFGQFPEAPQLAHYQATHCKSAINQ